jgi:hypothetical protein
MPMKSSFQRYDSGFFTQGLREISCVHRVGAIDIAVQSGWVKPAERE